MQQTKVYYGVAPSTKARTRCIFCKVLIPNMDKCIEGHINGAKHKEVMQMVNENAIYEGPHFGLRCNICKSVISDKTPITQHIENEYHVKWLEQVERLIEGEFISVRGFLANQTGNAYCEPCRVSIPCTIPSIEAHVNDLYHTKNIYESVKPLNGLFPTQNENKLWCKVCDRNVCNSPSHVLAHAEMNDRHSSWFSEMESLGEETDIYLGNYLAHEYENKVYCNKCRCEVLGTNESVENHIKSEEHQTNQNPSYIVEGNSLSLFYYNELRN